MNPGILIIGGWFCLFASLFVDGYEFNAASFVLTFMAAASVSSHIKAKQKTTS